MRQLSIMKLAVRNLRHRRVRTTFLIAFVLILSASLMASNVLTMSMEECINKTVDRIGADVIAAPKEFASELSDSLFSGERCSFYFDRSYMEDVAEIDGIERISPQLYVATLDASCCAVPVQIVAYEPETDFIVQPWLEGAGIDKLEKGQVVVGSRITAGPGSSIFFFGMEFEVAAKLEETETSYDNCAFMDFETAYTLFDSSQMKYVSDISEPETAVSLLMIRCKEGADAEDIADAVNKGMSDSGLQAFTVGGLFEDVAGTLNQLQSYSTLLIALLFLMAVLALICVFNITVNERHREFGILMSIGTQKGKIFKMLLLEAGIIGFIGGIAGIVISGGGILLFSDVITEKMNIPYLITGLQDYLIPAVRCLILSAATSILSTLYASAKASRMEPFRLIQEVDR